MLGKMLQELWDTRLDETLDFARGELLGRRDLAAARTDGGIDDFAEGFEDKLVRLAITIANVLDCILGRK